jgi:hypothetical protein
MLLHRLCHHCCHLNAASMTHHHKTGPSYQKSTQLPAKPPQRGQPAVCDADLHIHHCKNEKKRLIYTLTLSLELELSLSSQAVCSYMGEACRCGPWACMTKYSHCDPLRHCAEQTPSPHSGEEQELVCLVRTQKVHKYSPNM